MQLRALQGAGKPGVVIEVAAVVLETNAGTPVMVAYEMGGGFVEASHFRDSNFQEILHKMGYRQVVVVEPIALSDPKQQHNLPKIF
jgi:hypothetical protein